VPINPFEKRPQDFQMIVSQRIIDCLSFFPELDDVTVFQFPQVLGDSRSAQLQDVAQVARAKLSLCMQQKEDFQAYFVASELQNAA
jgi:hypothetical protein